MTNRKAKPKPQSKPRPVAQAPRPQGYSYERSTRGNTDYYEKKHPIKRVPGMRDTQWDREIGRWVVGLVKTDYQRQIEMDGMVW